MYMYLKSFEFMSDMHIGRIDVHSHFKQFSSLVEININETF